MLKAIVIIGLIGIVFLVFVYYASQVIMNAWINVIEKHFKNKSKEKQNEQKKTK